MIRQYGASFEQTPLCVTREKQKENNDLHIKSYFQNHWMTTALAYDTFLLIK